MSAEDTLIQVRKDKHHELNGGQYPLSSNVSCLKLNIQACLHHMDILNNSKQLITSIIPSELINEKILISGRITAFRKSGSITFIKVTDSTGSLQIIVSRNSYASYDSLKLYDLGDIVEVLGLPCLSKTGERSILAEQVNLLTKAHRPPPEKFAGISDPELKSRQRYLDLMSSENSRSRFMMRSYLLQGIRHFMNNRGFLEVETSTLNNVSSGANAKPFITHHNALDMDLYLRIAPELYLKRLLVGGLDRVYEIGRNYRNEGIDSTHNPEFTMMESYQSYANFADLIEHTKSLFEGIDFYLRTSISNVAVQNYYLECLNARTFSLSNFKEITMWDAVLFACTKAEILLPPTVHPLTDGVPVTNVEMLNLQNERLSKIDVKSLFHALNQATNNGQIIYSLFEYVAEPFLVEDYNVNVGDKILSCPIFITQYPTAVSPLARAMTKAPTLCERFELFINGWEVANGFQELNNPDDQAARFQAQLKSNNKDPMDYDSDYIEALEYGMPPAVGLGVGIDRLVMLYTNTTSIKDVILFPTLRPGNGD